MVKDASSRWDSTAWMVGEWSVEMEYWWNDTDKEKQSSEETKLVKVSLCPPQIKHDPVRERTRASAVRCWRLTAWVMARLGITWKV